MEITERHEKILEALIKEYISQAEPVSSKLLKKRAGLNVSPATIRNDCQELAEAGYIAQPHTSAGRIPTEKAFKYFVDKIYSEGEKDYTDFIVRQIEAAHHEIEQEMRLAEELIKSLSDFCLELQAPDTSEKDRLYRILIKLGPSRTTYDKNIDLINKIIQELENF